MKENKTFRFRQIIDVGFHFICFKYLVEVECLEADQEWQQQRAGQPGHGPQQAHHHQPHGGTGPGGLRSCPPQRGEAEVLRREAAEEAEHGDGDGEGPVPVDDDLEAAGVRGRGQIVGDKEHTHQQHPHQAQHRAQPPPRLAWEWS